MPTTRSTACDEADSPYGSVIAGASMRVSNCAIGCAVLNSLLGQIGIRASTRRRSTGLSSGQSLWSSGPFIESMRRTPQRFSRKFSALQKIWLIRSPRCWETIPHISLSTLHRLAPAAATAVPATRGVRVARYWMGPQGQRKRTFNVARPKIFRPLDFAPTRMTPVRVSGSNDLTRPLNSMSAPSLADTIAGADSRTA